MACHCATDFPEAFPPRTSDKLPICQSGKTRGTGHTRPRENAPWPAKLKDMGGLMGIMTNRNIRTGQWAPFLVVLVVLTGCQSGPTEVQGIQNIRQEELRQGGEARRTAAG